MDAVVSAEENITRFINQKTYFRSSDGTVRHNAFIPSPSGEVSVYRTTGINDSEIYQIGNEFFADITGKPLMGRADIVASEIAKRELRIEPDEEPHPRHANICGYPDEKSRQKLIAVELAAEAVLYLV